MPDCVFTMDTELLERCWLAKEMTGQIPDPVYIASLPVNYLDELALYGRGVKFFQDTNKRDPAMK